MERVRYGEFAVVATRKEIIVEVLEQQYDGEVVRRNYTRIPLDQVAGEEPLIRLWGRGDVPTCVKNCVERLHSQHRRVSI